VRQFHGHPKLVGRPPDGAGVEHEPASLGRPSLCWPVGGDCATRNSKTGNTRRQSSAEWRRSDRLAARSSGCVFWPASKLTWGSLRLSEPIWRHQICSTFVKFIPISPPNNWAATFLAKLAKLAKHTRSLANQLSSSRLGAYCSPKSCRLSRGELDWLKIIVPKLGPGKRV